jgi:hypothetical protein
MVHLPQDQIRNIRKEARLLWLTPRRLEETIHSPIIPSRPINPSTRRNPQLCTQVGMHQPYSNHRLFLRIGRLAMYFLRRGSLRSYFKCRFSVSSSFSPSNFFQFLRPVSSVSRHPRLFDERRWMLCHIATSILGYHKCRLKELQAKSDLVLFVSHTCSRYALGSHSIPPARTLYNTSNHFNIDVVVSNLFHV